MLPPTIPVFASAVLCAALSVTALQGFVVGHARTEATLARQDGRYDDARRALTAALRTAPDAWQAWADLALTARSAWVFQQQPAQLAQSLDAYRRAAVLNPDSAVPRAELARTLMVAGRFGEAGLAYREALSRDPRSPGLHVAYAQTLEAAQDVPGALAQYRAAEAIDANEYSQDAERRLGTP